MQNSSSLKRRDFLKNSALAGAGLFVARPFNITRNPFRTDEKVNIAVVGCGGRGSGIIFDNIPKIPEANLVAICDIIETRRKRAANRFYLRHRNQTTGRPKTYENFYEMLEKENLDAIAIATADFWHMPHTVAALEKGVHVYCEKAMSNKIEDAKKMAQAMKSSGKLLQIGRQRRSDDRYRFTYNKLIKQEQMFGRLTHAIGQWNRTQIWTQQPDPRDKLDLKTVQKYGFQTVDQVYNWRNYSKLGGGVVSDLGSHQIDIFNWFFQAYPHTVYATGNNSYFGFEQADTMATILEYETAKGPAIGIYEVISNSRAIGVHEKFIGDRGMITISQGPENKIYREARVEADEWTKYEQKGYIVNLANKENTEGKKQGDSGIMETAPQISYDIKEYKDMDKVYNMASHSAHLYNFVQAVRGKETLNHDAIESYKSEVCIYKIHEAINAGGAKIKIDPSTYIV